MGDVQTAGADDLLRALVLSFPSADLYHALLESMAEGVRLSDDNNVILYANAAEGRMFGCAPSDMIGRNNAEFTVREPSEYERFVADVKADVNQSAVWRGVMHSRRTDGSEFLSSARITRVEWQGKPLWLCVREDISDDIRNAEALRQSEHRLTIAIEAAQLGVWDWDLTTNTFNYSDRAKTICGFPLDQAVTYDQVRQATHPEDFPYTSLQAQRALDPIIADATPYVYRLVLPDGEVRWVRAHGQAVFDTVNGQKKAIRYVGTLQDITEQRRLQEAEQAAAQRLQLAVEAGRMAVWSIDLVSHRIGGSVELNRLYGFPDDATPTLENIKSHYAPGERERMEKLWVDAVRRGDRFFQADHQIKEGPSSLRWLQLRCEVNYSGKTATHAVGVIIDITEQRQAADAIRESEGRFRTLAHQAPAGIFQTDINGNCVFVNDRWCALAGMRPGEARGPGWMNALHPDDRERVGREWYEAAKTGADFKSRYRFRTPTGIVSWLEGSAVAVHNAKGDITGYIGSVSDITEHLRAEEQQTLLINELNHRVKNTLATVQAIASQSLRGAENQEDASQLVESRLLALSHAHDLLTENSWRGASVAEIVRSVLAAFRSSDERITIQGEDAALSPKQAVAVAMALHELATNALRHGALSNPVGKVQVSWTRREAEGEDVLSLDWRETGGPAAKRPERRGFGLRLIESHLARELRKPIEVTFNSDGVVAKISMTLSE